MTSGNRAAVALAAAGGLALGGGVVYACMTNKSNHSRKNEVDSGAVPKKPKSPAKEGRVPIFVMMPLDTVTSDCSEVSQKSTRKAWLAGLKDSGVRGIMVDVWWGMCEPAAGKYRFAGYLELCEICKELGLKLQAVMSFHQCGGNVGDSISIPIPAWALEPAKTAGLLYTDSCGRISEDCLSLSADNEHIFPDLASGTKRTALVCYRDFMAAFAKEFKAYLGSTIVEIQVGMGPCGELRYPSYMLSQGWNYPGTGLLCAGDSGMRKMLSAAAKSGSTSFFSSFVNNASSTEEYGHVPTGAPNEQNGKPDDASLFRSDFRNGQGAWFLNWYRDTLVAHGKAVLLEAFAAFPESYGTTLGFSVKVSGIHWHCAHPSRAAECCAGYCPLPGHGNGAYAMIARMLAAAAKEGGGRPVFFNFTCLEMRNSANVPGDDTAPEDLIAEVRRACISEGVPLCGENALQFGLPEDPGALEQIRKQARGWGSREGDRMHAVTLLRLDDGFARPSSLDVLREWISSI